MHWQDPDLPAAAPPAAACVDVRYRIRCPSLPVDHARNLRRALTGFWPWLEDEPEAGIHAIHGAESGNGWLRPEDPDARLPLSRRTRLAVRLPRSRLEAAAQLCGATLEVGADALAVGDMRRHDLQPHATMFARYIAIEAEDEEEFLRACAAQLQAAGIQVPRMMAGRCHPVRDDATTRQCRSLMLDGLDPEPSLRLQQQGLGPARLLGCGIFLPHKSIAPVVKAEARS